MPINNPPPSVPSGVIAMWHGTIANIPTGWIICDGNSGTPNLLARFVEGVATAATDPGATGGATGKTTTGHNHGIGYVNGNPGANGFNVSNATQTGTDIDAITDIRPIYYDVAFIMKT